MCDFVSGVIGIENERIYMWDFQSHTTTSQHFHLEPNTYCEFEWLSDDEGESLEVRSCESYKKTALELKVSILSRFPSRISLIQFMIKNIFKFYYDKLPPQQKVLVLKEFMKSIEDTRIANIGTLGTILQKTCEANSIPCVRLNNREKLLTKLYRQENLLR